MFNRKKENPCSNYVGVLEEDAARYILARTVVSNLVAGLVVSALFFPLESAKKIFQQGKRFDLSYKDMFSELRISGHIQGYVPYRGLPVFALNIVPTTFIQLTVEKELQKYIPNDSSNTMLILRALTSGSIGAVTATIVENTITRQQVMQGKFIPTLRDMWNISPSRVFKTYPLIAIRDSIFTLNLFFLHPKVERYLKDKYSDRFLSSSYFSAIPLSVLGATLSHPFDTLATNLQKTHEKSDYQKILKELLNSQLGFRSLFRGLFARIPLFYGFIVAIPEARKRCVSFIDSRFGFFSEIQPTIIDKDSEKNNSFFVRSTIKLEDSGDDTFTPKL